MLATPLMESTCQDSIRINYRTNTKMTLHLCFGLKHHYIVTWQRASFRTTHLEAYRITDSKEAIKTPIDFFVVKEDARCGLGPDY